MQNNYGYARIAQAQHILEDKSHIILSAILGNNLLQLLEQLNKSPALLNATLSDYNYKHTPLYCAVNEDKLDIVDLLLLYRELSLGFTHLSQNTQHYPYNDFYLKENILDEAKSQACLDKLLNKIEQILKEPNNYNRLYKLALYQTYVIKIEAEKLQGRQASLSELTQAYNMLLQEASAREKLALTIIKAILAIENHNTVTPEQLLSDIEAAINALQGLPKEEEQFLLQLLGIPFNQLDANYLFYLSASHIQNTDLLRSIVNLLPQEQLILEFKPWARHACKNATLGWWLAKNKHFSLLKELSAFCQTLDLNAYSSHEADAPTLTKLLAKNGQLSLLEELMAKSPPVDLEIDQGSELILLLAKDQELLRRLLPRTKPIENHFSLLNYLISAGKENCIRIFLENLPSGIELTFTHDEALQQPMACRAEASIWLEELAHVPGIKTVCFDMMLEYPTTVENHTFNKIMEAFKLHPSLKQVKFDSALNREQQQELNKLTAIKETIAFDYNRQDRILSQAEMLLVQVADEEKPLQLNLAELEQAEETFAKALAVYPQPLTLALQGRLALIWMEYYCRQDDFDEAYALIQRPYIKNLSVEVQAKLYYQFAHYLKIILQTMETTEVVEEAQLSKKELVRLTLHYLVSCKDLLKRLPSSKSVDIEEVNTLILNMLKEYLLKKSALSEMQPEQLKADLLEVIQLTLQENTQFQQKMQLLEQENAALKASLAQRTSKKRQQKTDQDSIEQEATPGKKRNLGLFGQSQASSSGVSQQASGQDPKLSL